MNECRYANINHIECSGDVYSHPFDPYDFYSGSPLVQQVNYCEACYYERMLAACYFSNKFLGVHDERS